MTERPDALEIDKEWLPAPDDLELPVGEIHAWIARLDHDDDRALDGEPTSDLSDDEIRRAARFKFDRDRDCYIRAHAVLRRLLGRYLGLAPREVRIVPSSTGKPHLVDDSALTFNLSHTKTFALFGFSRQGLIGVDVEYVRSSVDILSLAERFFTASESTLIANTNAHDRLRYFFTAWVRKEAVVKAVGRGLSIPLSAVDVAPGDPATLRTARLEEDPPSEWQVIDLPAPAAHFAAVATDIRPSRVRCFCTPTR